MRLLPVFLLALLVPTLTAQEVTAGIVGVVVDGSGLAIPGATVSVRSVERNDVLRKITTDSQGEFVATLLPIGKYSVKAERDGFKTAVRDGIELHVNDKLALRLELQVGQVTEQVTVEAPLVEVETQSPVAAGLVSGTEVTELSLNNRNFIQLLSLMPGITSNADTDEIYVGVTNPLGGTSTIPYSVNGSRSSGSNFMVDGADNVDRGSNLTLLAYPSVDSIAEFKVLRGLYSAEFGRASSGQVNVVSKSGSSTFHGSAYEFFRNDVLAANNFFNNLRGIKRPPLRYNNFGNTFNGPLPILGRRSKNKTFFFWSQEFRRIIGYTTLQATVPTNEMKQGIFARPVCIEYSGNTCRQTATQIPRIDPIATEYIQDIWSKIPAGDASNFNLFTPQRVGSNFREELIKIDHKFNERNSVSVRYVNDSIPSQEPGGLFTGAVIPNTATTSTNAPGHSWTVRLTSTFSTNLLNEAGWAYSYGAIESFPIGLMSNANSPDIKVTLPFPSTLSRPPSLSINGISSLTGHGPYLDYNRNYNAYDNLTNIRGQHTLKFGFSMNFYQKTENASTTNAGTFSFVPASVPSGTRTAEQGWANFLLGNVSTFSQASLDLTPDMRQRQFEAYAQDDWRARRNLTVSMGVRYSMFRRPYDANNFLTNFDPAAYDPAKAPQINSSGNLVLNTGDPLNGIIINGKNSPYGAKVENENPRNFAPRFGIVWDPTGKGRMSIRTGYAISYDSTLVGIYEQNIFANPPYVNSVTITNTLLDNPTAGAVSVSSAPKVLHGTPVPGHTPYTQQWSFDVQRQIGRNLMLDVGYYGSKGTHLLGIVDINQAPPGWGFANHIVTGPATSATTPLLNQIRPYRGYSAINTLENWFNSKYNSLQVSLQKRFRSSSSLRLAYTWSKVMTDSSSDRSNAPQNFYNRAAEYARATYDRTQVLTVSYIYQVPLARHAKGVVGAVAKGWEMSGIASFNTGLPLRVTTSGTDPAGLGLIVGSESNNIRPDVVGDWQAIDQRTVSRWFNTKAFVNVPAGQIRTGDAPAVALQGPGYIRFDLSMFKNFALAERWKLQFRMETFNTPNHTNFQGLSTSITSANYGQITSARDARRVQLGLKLSF